MLEVWQSMTRSPRLRPVIISHLQILLEVRRHRSDQCDDRAGQPPGKEQK